jgi:hypothetical protein
VPARGHSTYEPTASTATMTASQIRRIRISGLIGFSIAQGMSTQNSRSRPFDAEY